MMDKTAFEKLVEGQPDEIRKKGILLFNGVVNSAIEYQKTPTATNLRNWETAQAAFEKFKLQIEGGENHDTFKDIAAVLEYLDTSGWKVTKTSLYRHQSEGKIMPATDGSYRQKDVDKYAKTWLKQKSTGKKISERTDELQRKKLEIELKNLEIDHSRKAFAYEKDQGKYIPREQMEIELATRAGIFDAGLKHWIKSHVAQWIRLVDGDMQKVGLLLTQMSNDLNEHINSYASQIEYQVVIGADQEAGADERDQQEC